MPQLAPHIFELLHQQGVQHASGIPGDFALTLYDPLAHSKIKPIVMTLANARRFTPLLLIFNCTHATKSSSC